MTRTLPNLSYLVNVGELRYIQSTCEAADSRNPDTAVSTFLSAGQRLRCRARGLFLLPRLRLNPFYQYVLARTRYYDEVFLDAIFSSLTAIVNVGCGSDTRAYRFAHILRQKDITVLECDQPRAIETKAELAKRHWPTSHVRYVPVDLQDEQWPELENMLDSVRTAPILVMMEGVSPYISTDRFTALLSLFAQRSHPGSRLAYDFKIAGAADRLGRTGAVPDPFRLPVERTAVSEYHARIGYDVVHMESSSELCRRLLSGSPPVFHEDCLLKLSLGER